MRHTVFVTAEVSGNFSPSFWQLVNGRFEIYVESDLPPDIQQGYAHFPGLIFEKTLNSYGVRYQDRTAKLGRQSWHVLKYLHEHGSSEIKTIITYLKKKKIRTDKKMTQNATKQVRQRLSEALTHLAYPGDVFMDKGSFAVNVRD